MILLICIAEKFPDVFIPDGYVDVLKTENIITNDCMHGSCMIGFVVDDGIDVDNLRDMERLVVWRYKPRFVILPYCRWEKTDTVALYKYLYGREVVFINLNYEQICNPCPKRIKKSRTI